MERYANAKVYMIEPICEHEEGDIYIGSTCKKYLSQRFSVHTNAYKGWQKNKKKYVSSYELFEKYGFENCKIILLEDYPCDNKNQLLSREAHYQKSMKCVNKLVAFRSTEEWKEYHQIYHQENKEEKKIYYEQNKEQIKEQRKIYYDENKEQISEQRKIYYEENKEQISEQRKIYYEQNKEKKLEPITCECGSVITKNHYKKHCNSGKHQRLMSEKNEVI